MEDEEVVVKDVTSPGEALLEGLAEPEALVDAVDDDDEVLLALAEQLGTQQPRVAPC